MADMSDCVSESISAISKLYGDQHTSHAYEVKLYKTNEITIII